MAKPKPPIKQKYIETPEKMWELFCAYKEWVKSNPIKINDWVGGMGKKVVRTKERPLTIEGFECYCFNQSIINDLGDYFSNKNGKYETFSTICSRIRREVRTEQIEGGMAGIYNPSITQRLNGLVEKSAADDKTEMTLKVKYERKGNNTNGTAREPREGNTGG